jgi:hypothetical protein
MVMTFVFRRIGDVFKQFNNWMHRATLLSVSVIPIGASLEHGVLPGHTYDPVGRWRRRGVESLSSSLSGPAQAGIFLLILLLQSVLTSTAPRFGFFQGGSRRFGYT